MTIPPLMRFRLTQTASFCAVRATFSPDYRRCNKLVAAEGARCPALFNEDGALTPLLHCDSALARLRLDRSGSDH